MENERYTSQSHCWRARGKEREGGRKREGGEEREGGKKHMIGTLGTHKHTHAHCTPSM